MKNIIPRPVSIQPSGGSFLLSSETKIYLNSGDAALKSVGEYLSARLGPATGYPLAITEAKEDPPVGHLFFKLEETETALGEEGYHLNVSSDGIVLSANSAVGILRGVQTLRQLLPPKIESATVQPGPWEIPAGTITDYPRFEYRGAMLDVARHFFGVEDVKRYLDLLAYYKINAFHMHLTDDQGWRIEIKSWPNLTAHGSKSAVNGDPGGFYTQEDYREIVAYAQSLHITVIPEIDLPSHINAALSSYPELNADGIAPELYTGIEVGFNSLCADKEITYTFIDDVIRELAQITPGPYIHIGGDEAKVTSDEDYAHMITRVQDIVQSHGKQMIGWDEVLKIKLEPTSVVQYWRFAENYTTASENIKFIVSPGNKSYVDMKYHDETPLGLKWAGTVNVQQSYEWNPPDQVPGLAEENVLGVEAALWSETLRKIADIEFMAFPRLPGIAEIGWSPQDVRNWEDYKMRLAAHGPKLSALGVNFYRSPLVNWE